MHENDIDYQLASDLAVEVISEKSFMQISDETLYRAIERLSGCNTVINCLKCYGDMNDKNRTLYEKAIEFGLRVVENTGELCSELS